MQHTERYREFESHRFRQFIINRFMRDIIKLLDQIEEGSTPGFTIGSTIHSLLKGNGPNPGQNGKSNIVSVTQPSLGSIEIQIEYVDPSSNDSKVATLKCTLDKFDLDGTEMPSTVSGGLSRP